MELRWILFKVYYRDQEIPEKKRQLLMAERFLEQDIWIREYGKKTYEYGLSDVELINIDPKKASLKSPPLATGFFYRSPKRAFGREVDPASKTSHKASRDISDIADANEFLYNFETCVLAVRKSYPFDANDISCTAIRSILGRKQMPDPTETRVIGNDVHVSLMREEEFGAKVLDEASATDPVRRVKLKIVYPNPTGGRNDLSAILGTTEGDEANIDVKKATPGSLDVSRGSVLRRTVTSTVSDGYLTKGAVYFRDRIVDLLKAGPRILKTDGYKKDEEGEPLPLADQALAWYGEMEDAR